MPQNSHIWDQTRPNGRIREIYTVSQRLYTVCPVLTPGTAPLTDTFRSGQQLMCYSGLLPAINLGRHPEWHVSNFGRRPLSVSVAAGSPVPFWRKLRRGGNLFSVIFVLFQYVIFTSWVAEFSTSLFPCKGRATRCNTKNRAYFAQNCYSSLPRFVPNRVFRKILGQISWLMPLSGRSWIPARKRTQNSTKSMTTENEDTPADLIRKDSKKKDLKLTQPITSDSA